MVQQKCVAALLLFHVGRMLQPFATSGHLLTGITFIYSFNRLNKVLDTADRDVSQ